MEDTDHAASPPDVQATLALVRELVDEVRTSCLWFLDENFVPQTAEQALLALRSIERHGNRETYVRARRLRAWLSRSSSESSAAESPSAELPAERAT